MKTDWQGYIEEREDVMRGKPVFKRTRLTVELVLRQLGTGMTHQEMLDLVRIRSRIVQEYPQLRR